MSRAHTRLEAKCVAAIPLRADGHLPVRALPLNNPARTVADGVPLGQKKRNKSCFILKKIFRELFYPIYSSLVFY
jgi:hypothetical protein